MIRRDPLFKGCTRPALLFAVPLGPLFLVSVAAILLSLVTTILVITVLFPLVWVLRAMTQADDQQFRLLGLKLACRLMPHNNANRQFWQASVYSPLQFTKRKM
jgi:type IV secretion system protein VirB3